MSGPKIVIDSNVVVAGLRSQRGASHGLLRLLGSDRFDIHLSVPLFLEYAHACHNLVGRTPLTHKDIDVVLDYLCLIAVQRPIFFLWRPFLPDPDDDMVLELAVASQSDGIVTFNKRDFAGVDRFGLRLWSPREFLQHIGELP